MPVCVYVYIPKPENSKASSYDIGILTCLPISQLTPLGAGWLWHLAGCLSEQGLPRQCYLLCSV